MLDIGANIGIYTLLAAKRGAQVYAIEADTDNLRALGRHVELNGFSDRVTVLNVAAIDCERPVTLYRNPTNSGGSTIFGDGNGTMVRGCTVDSFDLPPLDVCKIDIEGAELLALRGMKNVLTRSPRLKLLIEYSQQSGRCEELLAFLHREFTSICVVGGSQISPSMRPPAFCNLWACRG